MTPDPSPRPDRRTVISLAVPALVLLLGTGCSPEDGFGPDPGDPGSETEVEIEFEFEVAISESIPTVAFIVGSVEPADCEVAVVQLVSQDGLEISFPASLDGEELSATLMGLKADTGYTARIAVMRDGEEHRSAEQDFVTGAVPSSIPDISVTDDTGGAERPGFLVTSVLKDHSLVVILDRDGDLVWWHDPVDEKCIISRASLTLDGTSVLYLMELPGEEMPDIISELVRVSLDGTEVTRVAVDGAHHDFVELADGTVAMLAVDARMVDGELSIADGIMELLPGGEMRAAWSAWDDFEPDPAWTEGLPDAEMGWSHANALDHDEASDSYLVGLRNLDAIVAVSRDSGELLWQLGGDDSDFEVVGDDGWLFEQQHQFHLQDGKILIFDNGTAERYESRVVQYTLDPSGGVATQVWQHRASPPLYCPVLGDVSRTADGTTLITWGTAGLLHEVAPDGGLVWSLGLDYGAGLGYTTLVEALPSP